MLKIREWLNTKNREQFKPNDSNDEIHFPVCAWRISDGQKFSIGDTVILNKNMDVIYRVFSFEKDNIHVKLVKRDELLSSADITTHEINNTAYFFPELVYNQNLSYEDS